MKGTVKVYVPKRKNIFIDFLLTTKYISIKTNEEGDYFDAHEMKKFVGSSFISPAAMSKNVVVITNEYLTKYFQSDARNANLDFSKIQMEKSSARRFNAYGSTKDNLFIYATEDAKWIIKDGLLENIYGDNSLNEYLRVMNVFNQLFCTMQIKRASIFDTEKYPTPKNFKRTRYVQYLPRTKIESERGTYPCTSKKVLSSMILKWSSTGERDSPLRTIPM